MTQSASVVIVDDNDSVRSSLRRLAESCGYVVHEYASAEGFLADGRPQGDACLLLDMRMPGMSGLELQEQLSLLSVPLPVIFVTGHADVPRTVRAMRGGAVDFLEKPIAEPALLASIERALEKDRNERSAFLEAHRVRELHETLTPREREVFALVVQGLLNKQVARRLGTAEKTIKVHRGRVMQKMRADSLAHLVRLADALAQPAVEA